MVWNDDTLILVISISLPLVAVGLVLLFCYRHDKHQLRHRVAEVELALDSEREKYRMAELALQDMERRLRMLRGFVGSVSDELSTSVSAIVGFAGVLATADDKSPLDAATRADVLSHIKTSSSQLAAVAESLNELSFYSQQRQLVADQSVIISELLQELVASYQSKTHVGVKLTMVDCLAHDLAVSTNSAGLRRVLCHVLDHAVTRTTEGEIVVGAGLYDTYEWLTISVADTSPALSGERRRHLFELSDADHDAVAAVGLPVSRIIMRLLGGSISADSAYRGGLRVVVRLPVQR